MRPYTRSAELPPVRVELKLKDWVLSVTVHHISHLIRMMALRAAVIKALNLASHE